MIDLVTFRSSRVEEASALHESTPAASDVAQSSTVCEMYAKRVAILHIFCNAYVIPGTF